jgi:hypothetical protein
MSDKKNAPLTKELINEYLKDAEHDWMVDLKENEVHQDGKTQYPKINGLRRLARIRGIVDMDVDSKIHTFYSNTRQREEPIAQVTVKIVFADGEVTAATADAFPGNSVKYGHFMTSYAGTRAEARAIRRAFGIEMVAYEEVDDQTVEDAFGNPNDKITAVQKRHIEKMSKSRKMNLDVLIKDAFNKELSIEELTNAQATQLIRFINDGKK